MWRAQPTVSTYEHDLADGMADARSAEYQTLIAHAAAAASAPDSDRTRTVRRLRDELRRIHRRDYFPPAERDAARFAVETLARRHFPGDVDVRETHP
ncbi:MAG: Protein chrB [Mycobacterium sp.]|nr:Protein chrB [Mycobacterium sp.]